MRRTGKSIMWSLLKLLGFLGYMMCLCILLGTIGFLCATAITVLAANLLLLTLDMSPWPFTFLSGALIMGLCALLRAVFRYGEQLCGHYIAFKLLYMLRDRVFTALRRLAPAKLEGRGRGDLIALITGDIELLEVFYAYTIAPVCIAVLVSAIMCLVIGSFHILLGVIALISYLLVGCALPILSARLSQKQGMDERNSLGALNGRFLECLRGIKESRQFGQMDACAKEIEEQTEKLNALQIKLKRHEGITGAWSAVAVGALPLVTLGAGLYLQLPFQALVLSAVILASSFGPVIALANLSATMSKTLAAGERVLALLEEQPETEEIQNGKAPVFTEAEVKNVTFSYGEPPILQNISIRFPQNSIVAITGKSGCGKSTLLRLLMRFWKTKQGQVLIAGEDIENIETRHLRSIESYMTQDTDLFHDSIGNNIRLAKQDATKERLIEAAKKASLHDFIMTLPQGYDTPVGELGETLSSGQRQRIGLARIFLRDAEFLLLDEPTSNLDALNEGVILKALQQHCRNKTVVLVSHRASTLSIADSTYTVENGGLR